MSSQLTYAHNSLTYQLLDTMKQSVGFGKLYHRWVCEGTAENAQEVYYVSQIFTDYPSLNWKFSILKRYRLKIRKVIEFFYFQSLMHHLLCRACCKKFVGKFPRVILSAESNGFLITPVSIGSSQF